MFRKFAALSVTVSLAACGQEAGHSVDGGAFGDATMNNAMVMSGEKDYTIALGNRFAQEVPVTVLFEFNSSQIDAEAAAILDKQADWIRQFPEVRFRVYGNTDLVGSQSYNKRLGMRRARAVVSYLSKRGISRSRLEAVVSYGETRPVINVPGPERKNRRSITEVTGFVRSNPLVLDGKYAQVVYRDYVESAIVKVRLSDSKSSGDKAQ